MRRLTVTVLILVLSAATSAHAGLNAKPEGHAPGWTGQARTATDDTLGVPVHDECVDAIPIDSGTCRQSGSVCQSSDDCTGFECAFTRADCTADPEVCSIDDLCEDKVCTTGPVVGASCNDDPDCNGGFCDGTCGLTGAPCYGPPGEEPQCAGPEICVPEKCVLRATGSTVGAVTAGEAFGFGFAADRAQVPGVWYTLTGTGNFVSQSLCNPGTDYWVDSHIYCRDCDRLISTWGLWDQGDRCGCDAQSTCGANALGIGELFCTQKDVEYRIFVYGSSNPCQRTCDLLGGGACDTDEDCVANTCVGPFCDTGGDCDGAPCPVNVCDGGICLTGQACTVDGDCPANACNTAECLSGEGCTEDTDCPVNACGVGQCFLTGEDCESDGDCPDTTTGNYELTVTDSGVPCEPFQQLDCLAGNQVQVVDAILSDDGDDDGWADTNETVEMRIRVRNYGDEELTGLVAELSTDDPKIAAISEPSLSIGTLGPKETRITAASFHFAVADVERSGIEEDFSVRFEVALASDGWEASHRPQHVVLDLDLDVAGGAGPSRYHEGFESGDLGTFVPMNLDLSGGSLQASDGYRCRYNDPDNPAANQPGRATCFLGGTAENAESFFWQVEGPEAPDGGRAFEGSHALRMGLWIDGEATTPRRVLEAVRSGEPLLLGGGSVCDEHRGLACAEDADCPVGETCVEAAPELSFKHQAALYGSRKWCDFCDGVAQSLECTGTGSLEPCRTRADCPTGQVCRQGINAWDELAIDRGVVQVQRAALDGSAAGPWMTLEPYEHVYDSLVTGAQYANCSFDPVDDGTTEDDAFQPGEGGYGYDDPAVYGPSSTCAGTRVFNFQGDTDFPFDPGRVGRSFDGPGLEGATGLGTWVAPRFSLWRFRGQRVRLRFLNSALEFGPGDPWPALFADQTHDGWWIDDVAVRDVVNSPAVLAVDDKTCAPGVDGDGDGRFDCRDCAPGDDQAWAAPGAPRPLFLDHSGGSGGTTTLSWTPPASPGAVEIVYSTLVRGPGLCEESGVGDVTFGIDTHTPSRGELLQFLVRASNACGPGTLGLDTAGTPRPGCP